MATIICKTNAAEPNFRDNIFAEWNSLHLKSRKKVRRDNVYEKSFLSQAPPLERLHQKRRSACKIVWFEAKLHDKVRGNGANFAIVQLDSVNDSVFGQVVPRVLLRHRRSSALSKTRLTFWTQTGLGKKSEPIELSLGKHKM